MYETTMKCLHRNCIFQFIHRRPHLYQEHNYRYLSNKINQPKSVHQVKTTWFYLKWSDKTIVEFVWKKKWIQNGEMHSILRYVLVHKWKSLQVRTCSRCRRPVLKGANVWLIYEAGEFGDVISRYEYLMRVYTVAGPSYGYTDECAEESLASSNGKPLVSRCRVLLSAHS